MSENTAATIAMGQDPKETTKEATDDDCLQVLCGGNGKLKDCKAEHANKNG